MSVSKAALSRLYGADAAVLAAQVERYRALAGRFASLFPRRKGMRLLSAPGRAEISGNHTDHQHGRVLAAAVSVDTVAAVAPSGDSIITLHSEGFPPIRIDLSDLAARPKERGTTAAVLRGCAARMAALGFAIGGFDAAVTSSVPVGSGLSSSAAFEVLTCAIFDSLFNRGDMQKALRAEISQYAENVHFGKPSGLMDQTASSFGGLVAIDFGGKAAEVQPLSFDFAAHGLSLAVVNTGGSHDDLTDAYAAIRTEMEQVAACFGKEKLREVEPSRFEAELPSLRSSVSERALLRAMHFFDENERVTAQVQALLAGDTGRFLELTIASGESSWKLLQNLYASPESQPIPLALELSRRMLSGRGAWRVHGGGFAGTILAFVPIDQMEAYRARLDSVFGAGACQALNIRPEGAVELTMEG